MFALSAKRRINPLAFLLAFAVGLSAIGLSELKPTWALLIMGLLGLLCIIPVLAYSGVDMGFFFLCIYALLLPIDISKAITFTFANDEAVKYIAPHDIASFFMIVFWLISVLSSRKTIKIHFSNILVPFFFMACWGELSVVNAVKPHMTLMFITTYVKWFFILLSIANIMTTKKHFKIVFMFVMASVFFESFYAFMQYKQKHLFFPEGLKATQLGRSLSFGSGYEQIMRPSGTMHHPNVLASFLVYCLQVLFALLLMKRKFLSKPVVLLALAAGLFSLLVTYSRGGWLGFALAAAVILGIAVQRKMIESKTLVSLFLVALIFVGALFPLWKPFFLRLTKPDESSTTSRIMMLKQSFMMAKEHPFLGVGLVNYAEAGKDYIPDQSNLIRYAAKGVVHNRYAGVMAETGFVGLFFFLWLLWRVLKNAYKNVLTVDPEMRFIALGLLGSLVGIFAGMALDHFADNTRNVLFWFYTGLITAIGHHFKAEPVAKTPPPQA